MHLPDERPRAGAKGIGSNELGHRLNCNTCFRSCYSVMVYLLIFSGYERCKLPCSTRPPKICKCVCRGLG